MFIFKQKCNISNNSIKDSCIHKGEIEINWSPGKKEEKEYSIIYENIDNRNESKGDRRYYWLWFFFTLNKSEAFDDGSGCE